MANKSLDINEKLRKALLSGNAQANDFIDTQDLQDQIDDMSVAPTGLQNIPQLQKQVSEPSGPPVGEIDVGQPKATFPQPQNAGVQGRNLNTRDIYQQGLNKNWASEEEGIAQQDAMLQEQLKLGQAKAGQTNLSPLYDILNSWYGTQAGKSYKPQDSEEDMAKSQKLMAMLQESKQKLGTEKSAALKSMLEQDNTAKMLGMGVREQGLAQRAFTDYKRDMKPVEQQLFQAARMGHIVDQIKNDAQDPTIPDAEKLKATSHLTGEIETSLASMFNNGKPATVHGMEMSQFNNLYRSAMTRLSIIKSNPMSVLNEATMNNLKLELGMLQKAYQGQYQDLHDAATESAVSPMARDMMERRFGKIIKNIFGDTAEAHGEEPQKKIPPPKKIKVSNGEKPLFIDPQDLAAAEAEGYKKGTIMSDWKSRATPVSDWKSRATTASESDQEMPEPSLGEKAAGIAGKVLDYPAGIVRTGAYGAADLATKAAHYLDKDIPESDLLYAEDLMSALKGEAPTTAQIAERKGISKFGSLADAFPGLYNDTGEGWKFQRGGWADPSGRGTAGFAVDQVLDPLNWMTFGGAGAAKVAAKEAGLLTKGAAKSQLGALAKVPEYLGEKIYRSGSVASKADGKAVMDAAARGETLTRLPSDVLEENFVRGKAVNQYKDIHKLARDKTKFVEGTLSDIDKQIPGAGDYSKILKGPLSEAEKTKNNLNAPFEIRQEAQEYIDDTTKKYKDRLSTTEKTAIPVVHHDEFGIPRQSLKEVENTVPRKVPLQSILDDRRQLSFQMKKEFENPELSRGDYYSKLRKMQYAAENNELRGAAEEAGKQLGIGEGLGKKLAEADADASLLMSAEKPLKVEARKSSTAVPHTSKLMTYFIDPAISLAGYAGNAIAGNPVRSYFGLGLSKGGAVGRNLVDKSPRLLNDSLSTSLKSVKNNQNNPYDPLKR